MEQPKRTPGKSSLETGITLSDPIMKGWLDVEFPTELVGKVSRIDTDQWKHAFFILSQTGKLVFSGLKGNETVSSSVIS
jgi:hypothetical protein